MRVSFFRQKSVRSGPTPAHASAIASDSKLLIAVMGHTGSGKSRFISLCTGKDVVIGHGLESCTTNVQEVDVQIDEKTVTLIDTPGFGDTNRTDTEVLTEIANYLESNYRQNRRLTGIIFLHRITDNRMGNVSCKNVLMFQKLVGNSVLDHVICCTTMWDREEEPNGEFTRREGELKTKFWRNMVTGGAQIARHNNTAQSARSIIAKIVYKKRVTLRIQKELVDDKKKLSGTSAGVAINKEQALAEASQQKKLKEIEADLQRKRANNNARMMRLLKEQRVEGQRKLRKEERAFAMLEEKRWAELQMLEDLVADAEWREEELRSGDM